jgi:hypothetical protein
MEQGQKFSPVRATAISQIATVAFAIWFMFNSLRMSCSMSGDIASCVLLVHTINSALFLAAILFERKWRLVALPVVSWFIIGALVIMTVH